MPWISSLAILFGFEEVLISIWCLGCLRILHLLLELALEISICYIIQQLPNALGFCYYLCVFDLKNFQNLVEFPTFICNKLDKLQELDLSNYSKLQNLLDKFENMSILQHFKLNDCQNLETIPPLIGKLKFLKYLDLSKCNGLKELHKSICKLSTLQILNLSSSMLQELFDPSIGQLTTL